MFLLTTLHYFLIPEINYVLFITKKKKKKKEKKERGTKKELIGSLGYVKCISSLSVELSSCYLAWMGHDKTPPPHQVRTSVHQWTSGLPGCSSLKLEQSSTCPRLLLSAWLIRRQDKWKGADQTLDQYLTPIDGLFCLLFLHLSHKRCQPFKIVERKDKRVEGFAKSTTGL